MNPSVLFITIFTLLSTTALYAQDRSVVLAPQKSSALAAHLTTRIHWRQFPQINYHNDDLQGQDRAAILRINADESGNITQVQVQESTGIRELDNLLITAVKRTTIKPSINDGTAVPTIGYQAFDLDLKKEQSNECTYHFLSKNWLEQSNQKTPFRYLEQPRLHIQREELQGSDRLVRFHFKVNKHGQVTKIKIKKGSGIYALDEQVMRSVLTAHVTVPTHLWFFKKSHLKDEIWFKLDHCD